MPAIDNYTTTTTTIEDFMPSSALSVSPILTGSIFDEISASPDTATLAISDATRLRLLSTETRLLRPPRWRRRVRRPIDPEDETSSGEDINHIGPVRSRFMYGQNCIHDRAVNTNPLCHNHNNILDFEVVFDDGGQYG